MEINDSLPFNGQNPLESSSDITLSNIASAAGSGGFLFGEIGNDTLTPTNFNLVFAGDGNDTVEATAESGDNRIYSGNGNDLLNAGNNDRVFGGTGNDTLNAGEGENNRLYAGEGDDKLFAGNGNNILVGGTGIDRFWLAENNLPQAQNTILDFEVGVEKLVFTDVAEVTEFDDLTLTDTADGVLIQVGEKDRALLLGVSEDDLSEGDFRIFPIVDPGDKFNTAFQLGNLNIEEVFEDSVGTSDRIDFYSFTLTENSEVTLNLTGLTDTAN
jgi:Ca2+-binding RTX toxin-like protein